ncbi:hypothetical protein [Saccharothrix hoggarensis]|uniref:Uncharacterized protein n=1 Tax=Saccharothrix hoggarensis TaxID=913853 RepID=A0ABW3QRT0_9PSEU
MRKDVRLGAATLVLCGLAGCGGPGGTASPAAPTSTTSSTTPAPPPTASQVEWLDQFCQATAVFTNPPQPPPDLRDEFTAMDLEFHLRAVDTALDTVSHQTNTLTADEFPRGRELIDAYTGAAKELGERVTEYANQHNAGEDVLREHVAETTSALEALEPDGLDLADLVAENGTVAQAHEQAEHCRPAPDRETTPAAPVDLPAAADGGNLAACEDGACEVLVSPSAVVPVPRRYGFTLVRVRSIGDGVALIGAKTEGGAMTSPLTNGRSTVMNGLSVTAVAVGEGKAVLRFSPA